MELKSSGGGTIVMGVVESISMMRTQVLHINLPSDSHNAFQAQCKTLLKLLNKNVVDNSEEREPTEWHNSLR